jgi:hypothetical protein
VNGRPHAATPPVAADARERSERPSSIRVAIAGLLVLVYALPLFVPPPPVHPIVATGDVAFLVRLFPTVPPLWIVVRLVALAVAAALVCSTAVSVVRAPFDAIVAATIGRGGVGRRGVALAIALLHAASAPWAYRLGPAGQTSYLLLLLVPALLLVRRQPATRAAWTARAWRAAPTAAVIVAWMAVCLVNDRDSPRVADMTDAWYGFYAIATFLGRPRNFVTELVVPEYPGFGSNMVFLGGVPLFQSGLVALSLRSAQIIQVCWLAACAAGIAALARALVGTGVAAVAAAVFLFGPYTRFIAIFPGPFVLGPVYGIAIALCAVAACRRRSEAALAAMGGLSGVALTFPGLIPPTLFLVALTAWQLRHSWREVWLGALAGAASFAAAVVPAIPEVFTPARMVTVYGRMYGVGAIMEAVVLGQLSLGALDVARSLVVRRPVDTVVAAVLAPFAHPRLSIRLWGDAIFDPIGAALMAIGMFSCIRAALRGSAAAWFLLVFYGVALGPAFVSPMDRVDITHGVVLPVPATLLAAAGFAVVSRRVALGRRARRIAAAATALAIAAGGTVLFDVVNPRILAAAAPGVMFRVLQPDAEGRVVVLNHPNESSPWARWLFVGAVVTFTRPHPLGYFEYGGGELPAGGFAAEGKDLLFWSPGLEQDVRVMDGVCAQWPGATLFQVWDEAHLSAVYAARIGSRDWEPHAPAERWHRGDCGSRAALRPEETPLPR